MTTFYKPTALSDQLWSWIFVLSGAAMVLVFKHFGVDTGIAAGVIGAGLQSFTSAAKNSAADTSK